MGRCRHHTADICPEMPLYGAQARSNVGKRLEFIRRELERLASQADSLSEKHARKQQQARPPRRCYPPPPPPPPSRRLRQKAQYDTRRTSRRRKPCWTRRCFAVSRSACSSARSRAGQMPDSSDVCIARPG